VGGHGGGEIDRLSAVSARSSLARRGRLTELARRARPLLEDHTARRALDAIEALIGRSIDVVARGPTAGDVRAVRS
jgi:hypothetical protein